VCEARQIPLWCGEHDAHVVEGRRPEPGQGPAAKLLSRLPLPQPNPVERRLKEGDEVAGFTVLDAPGHSAGHVVFWRESDRVLILGDVLNNMDVLTGVRGLREPKDFLTPDPARNRESVRKVAALGPELACFGHGPPLRDPKKLADFVATLPA
jgi:hydroxyacylglutathione hydrolase